MTWRGRRERAPAGTTATGGTTIWRDMPRYSELMDLGPRLQLITGTCVAGGR
jgi:hypothetical protein